MHLPGTYRGQLYAMTHGAQEKLSGYFYGATSSGTGSRIAECREGEAPPEPTSAIAGVHQTEDSQDPKRGTNDAERSQENE